MSRFRLAVPSALLLFAGSASAQDLSPAIRQAAMCAPVGTGAASEAPRVMASSDAHGRTVFTMGETIPVRGAVAVGQRYFVRRPMRFHGAPQAQHTIATVTIAEVSSAGAVARIDTNCDGVAVGDHLEPFAELDLPAGLDRNDGSGRLDPSTTMRVSYGIDGHTIAGGRDYMLADEGADDGLMAGNRYAVFHAGRNAVANDPPFAEAIVVSVFPGSSLLRITAATDAVETGDRLVLRIPNPASVAAENLVSEEPRVAAAEPPSDEADEGGARNGAGQTFTFDDLYFDFNKQTLRPEAVALLDRAISVLKEHPGLKVSVEGYTCDIGTPEFNLALGERRAKEVHKYLVTHGVDPSRLTVVSYGEENPKYDNTKKDTRKLNRRAALTVNVHAN